MSPWKPYRWERKLYIWAYRWLVAPFHRMFLSIDLLIMAHYRILIAVIYFFVGCLLYWTFFDNGSPIQSLKPVSYGIHNRMDTKRASVDLKLEICSAQNIQASLQSSFVGDIIYALPWTNVELHKGCHQYTYFITIPNELKSGHYIYNVNYSYTQNPLKSGNFHKELFALHIYPKIGPDSHHIIDYTVKLLGHKVLEHHPRRPHTVQINTHLHTKFQR